jgi:hypothetical protein
MSGKSLEGEGREIQVSVSLEIPRDVLLAIGRRLAQYVEQNPNDIRAFISPGLVKFWRVHVQRNAKGMQREFRNVALQEVKKAIREGRVPLQERHPHTFKPEDYVAVTILPTIAQAAELGEQERAAGKPQGVWVR